MKRYWTLGFLAGLALLVALVAPGLAQAQTAPQDVAITLNEFSITPNTLTVMQGQPVHFTVTNIGKFPHSVSFTKDGQFLTVFAAPIAAGKSGSADFIFEQAGTWTMYCPVSTHAEHGMTGQVTVLAAGAEPGMPTTGAVGSLSASLLLVAALALGVFATGVMLRRRTVRADR